MVKHARTLIKKIQAGKVILWLPIFREEALYGLLRALNTDISKEEIRLLRDWRIKHKATFKDVKKPTLVGTERWFRAFKNRILFLIEDNQPIGHMGLFRFDFKGDSVEIDNVVRGTNRVKGIMGEALDVLIRWTIEIFKPKHIYLQVLQENKHAIEFYKKHGFKIIGETILNGYKEFKMEKVIYYV